MTFISEKKPPLVQRVEQIRELTQSLLIHLSEEDQCVQSMPDASPSKWHLGHTTWFWEAVILLPHCPGYKPFNAHFNYIFNSYYESMGPRQPRPQRGLLTRPALEEVMAYRAHVTEALMRWLQSLVQPVSENIGYLIELGVNNEQQHQELLVTDHVHLFSCNPLWPKSGLYLNPNQGLQNLESKAQWFKFDANLCDSGQDANGDCGFSFDNEQPRHKRWIEAFEISNQLITCREYLEFIQDGGYQNPSLWLSEGWAWVNRSECSAPAYWLSPQSAFNETTTWKVFGVDGVLDLQLSHAVTHLNFFEADAFAQWRGARLPTEFEWEHAFDHQDILHMRGQAWQWTRSAYEPYRGFKPRDGAIREYNGKFMVGQQVLRGSSWATPKGHARQTYRNFFPPAATWQITGLRLARDCK
jgi:ergothioneine biosynthesis protein EgtB